MFLYVNQEEGKIREELLCPLLRKVSNMEKRRGLFTSWERWGEPQWRSNR